MIDVKHKSKSVLDKGLISGRRNSLKDLPPNRIATRPMALQTFRRRI